MDNWQNTFIVKEDVLINNFKNYSALGNVCYPMKTNSSLPVISILKEQIENGENYFSISNFSHFEKLESLKISPQKILLINTIASIEVFNKLYKKGVRFFTFDNIASLQSFSKHANLNECKLFFRISINEVFNLHSHIGASAKEVKQMLEFIKKYNSEYGISFYIPKEINYKKNSLKKMLKFIEKNFSNVDIKFVSIAGIKEPNSINKELLNELKSVLHLNKIFLEPGEFMLYRAIDLKTSTLRYKDDKRKLLIIRNGIFSGMLDKILYNKNFDISILTNNKSIPLYHNKSRGRTKIYVYGGSGDSADYLGKYYIQKEFESLLLIKQELLIHNAGAYFEEFYIPRGEELKIKYEIIKQKGENDEI